MTQKVAFMLPRSSTKPNAKCPHIYSRPAGLHLQHARQASPQDLQLVLYLLPNLGYIQQAKNPRT